MEEARIVKVQQLSSGIEAATCYSAEISGVFMLDTCRAGLASQFWMICKKYASILSINSCKEVNTPCNGIQMVSKLAECLASK